MSDDDRASGRTSAQDIYDKQWEAGRSKDGLFESVRDAYSILINGSPPDRLNKKTCHHHGSKLVILLIADGLYSGGVLVTPTSSEWAIAQLRTIHRGPYIQDRDTRRGRAEDCFRSGVNLTLFGTSAKRRQIHIEEELMTITTGKKYSLLHIKYPPTRRRHSAPGEQVGR